MHTCCKTEKNNGGLFGGKQHKLPEKNGYLAPPSYKVGGGGGALLQNLHLGPKLIYLNFYFLLLFILRLTDE